MKKFKKYKKLFLVKLPLFNKRRKELIKKIFIFIQEKPFTSFFAVLAVFFVLMAIGNVLFSPKAVPEQNITTPKKFRFINLVLLRKLHIREK